MMTSGHVAYYINIQTDYQNGHKDETNNNKNNDDKNGRLSSYIRSIIY